VILPAPGSHRCDVGRGTCAPRLLAPPSQRDRCGPETGQALSCIAIAKELDEQQKKGRIPKYADFNADQRR
jgi:hypothetical protein